MNIVQHHNIQCWRIRHIPRYMRAPNDMSSTPLLSPKTSKNAAFAEHHVIQIIPDCSLFNKSEMTWIARCTTSLLMQALSMLYQQSKVAFNVPATVSHDDPVKGQMLFRLAYWHRVRTWLSMNFCIAHTDLLRKSPLQQWRKKTVPTTLPKSGLYLV